MSKTLSAHAVLVGERINLRQLSEIRPLSQNPLMVEVAGGGTAALFRFGVAVFFDVTPVARSAFINHLQHLIPEPASLSPQESDQVQLQVDAEQGDSIDQGVISIADQDLGRLQVVADILAKSLLLATYEASIGSAFDRVEPFAERLQRHGRGARQARQLIRHIGETLLIQHRMVGRAEVGEKPEILWDRPELERLFSRLEQEYEIRERQLALERKLALIGTTAETLLDMLQNKRSLRVEWYIVILIVVEILLSLYELFFRHT